MRAKIVARCVVDDDGNRLFSDADVTALGEKSGAPIDRIFAVAARLSGMGEEDTEKLAADFSEAGGDALSSPLHATSAARPKRAPPRLAAPSRPNGPCSTGGRTRGGSAPAARAVPGDR